MEILDENVVHKIELFEIDVSPFDIKQFFHKDDMEIDGTYLLCDVDGKSALGKVDTRGKKSKFWISDGVDPYAYLVKYGERKVHTEEDAGQFLMCGLLEQLDIPYAKYLVTEFVRDGKSYDAIISKNYREGENTMEMSGSTLNQKWVDTNYDNNFGVKPQHKHTVEFYYDIIRTMYRKNSIDFEQLRTDLLKYCLLQYVFDMSDLHYYNVSFSYDRLKGHDTFKLNPYYDCGNICSLNFSEKKIKNNATQYAKSRDCKSKQKFVKNLIYSNMPLFGVKSDICQIYQTDSGFYTCRPRCELFKGKECLAEAQRNLETLQRELAEEILENAQLSEFYLKIKNLDIDKAAEKYNAIKDGTIPSYCIDLVKAVKNETEVMLDLTLADIEKERALAADESLIQQAEEYEEYKGDVYDNIEL